MPLFDDELTFVVDPEIPDGGDYDGLAGVRTYMERFLEPWESLTIAAESMREAGDKVLVRVVQNGIGQGSGVPVEMRYCQVWTFQDGRVTRLEVILDEERALEAAGQRLSLRVPRRQLAACSRNAAITASSSAEKRREMLRCQSAATGPQISRARA